MLTKNRTSGFSLIELVITVTVLAILTLAAVPMVQVSVKRQKEQQLHEALRTMREAIDQFHREALAGSRQQPANTTTQQELAPRNVPNNQLPAVNPLADPRVRVFVSDQTTFTVDNMDRYPPDLVAYLHSLQGRLHFQMLDLSDPTVFGGTLKGFYDPVHMRIPNVRRMLDYVVAHTNALQ